MDEKELEVKINVEELDVSEEKVEEEPKAEEVDESKEKEEVSEEVKVEQTEEEQTEEPTSEVEENVEEQKEENPLKEAIMLLANASKEDIESLDDEAKEALAKLQSEQDLRNIEAKLSFISKAIDAFQNTIVRSLDDNEEFRTLSKFTLQKNVTLLEDQVKLNQFNRILRPLSALYSNYEFMLDAPIDEKKTRSNIEGILEEVEALLEEYGAEKIEAKVGEPFNPLLYKIAKKVETNDQNLDKTVAAVKSCGWKKDRIVFVPARADMYVYTEQQEASNEEAHE